MSQHKENIVKTSLVSHIKPTEGRLVPFTIIGMIAAFAILIFFVSEGGVRHVPITFKEKIEAAVAFRNIDGEIKVAGIAGNTQVNPTLVSRSGHDTVYALTVINQDNDLHMLYIDGLNLHTKILRPGDTDTITIYPKQEGSYNYYDRLTAVTKDDSSGGGKATMKPLGEFRIVKVAGD
jgi:hypothetical protein